MAALRTFLLRILDLFRRRRLEHDLDEEIQSHLVLLEERFIRQGMNREEARLAARRSFGGIALLKEDHREQRAFVWPDRLLQDVRYGLRTMRRNPGFTAVAVISLALGIGANCAMFSLADVILLRPLPIPRPNELLNVGSVAELEGNFSVLLMSHPDYVDVRDRGKSFEGLAAFTNVFAGFAARPEALPSLKLGNAITANMFDVLKIKPALGRGFHPEEDRVPGRDAVVILDHGFWKNEFAADPSILGRRVRINRIEFTIVGVAPEGFAGLRPNSFPSSFFVPFAMLPRLSGRADRLERRDLRDFRIKGRLKPGVTIHQARAELAAFAATLAQEYPDTNRNQTMAIRTEMEARIAQSPPDAMLVAMLLTLAGAVLLVACANVGGLLTSRAPSRAKELAIRMAVGAGRIRLIRQLIVESLLLALAGGTLGLAVGYGGMKFFQQIRTPNDLGGVIPVQMDQRFLMFALAAALLSTVLFGLLPALQTTRIDLTEATKIGDVKPSSRRLRGRSLLVIGQVAVSLLLLAVTTFLYRAFQSQLADGPGYRLDHVLMMSFNPALAGYDQAKSSNFYKELLEGVRSTPGVKSATLTSEIPMGLDTDTAEILPEGYTLPQGRNSLSIPANRVDESFFQTMGVPIEEGRGFRAMDSGEAPRVAVVNETAAQEYWPGQSAIGKRFRLGNDKGPWVEVIGVARNHKYMWIAEPPTEFVYLHHLQNPRQGMTLLVESLGEPASLTEPLREVIRRLDPNQPVFDVFTMEEFYQARTITTFNVLLTTVGAMGLMALLLALVGLYGLTAFAIGRRTREIGIRMAIGAGRRDVLKMALRQGATLALYGLGVGVVLSIVAERLLPAVFPAYHETDIIGYLLVIPALLAVTLLAAYIPSRRASRMDPTGALRYE